MEKCVCPVCKLNDVSCISHFEGKDQVFYNCDNCGTFKISLDYTYVLKQQPMNPKLSFALRSRHANQIDTLITSTNIDEIVNSVDYPALVMDKVDLIIKAIYEQDGSEDGLVICGLNNVAFGIESIKEMDRVLKFAKKRDFLELHELAVGAYCKLGAAGIERAEELFYNLKSNQAFVAMCFDPELSPIYENAIKPALIECGYEPVRIDDKQFNGEIMAQIVKEIKKSSLLLADFTNNSKGVYFEAGAATSIGINVIYSCRKDEIEKLHFDVNHFKYIDWINSEDFKDAIVKRISDTGLRRHK